MGETRIRAERLLEEGAGAWDFPSATPDPLGKLHPYPAKFIPELPRKLIEEFKPLRGTTILDPFCGSGTTLSEAQSAGTASYGVDLNPIATLISRVRTSPTPPNLVTTLETVARAARETSAPTPSSIPRLDHWFRRGVQEAVAAIKASIDLLGSDASDVLRLALSSILVRVSNQESDTRYAAVDKAIEGEDVHQAFLRAGLRIAATIKQRRHPLPPCEVIEADVLGLGGSAFERPVGLVVTSPPYPNAYEYWLYHKYRMWWLGFDPLAVKAKEIGARAHFFRGRSGHTAEDFARQMGGVLDLVREVLVPGGHTAFVVGRSRIHGETVDNAATIIEGGRARGFREVFRAERIIAPTRKSFNLSHAGIKTETILVMRLD